MAAQVNFEIEDWSMAAPAPVKQTMTDGQTVIVVQQQPIQGTPVYVQPQQGYPQQGYEAPPVYQDQAHAPGGPTYGQPVYVQQQPQPGKQHMQ